MTRGMAFRGGSLLQHPSNGLQLLSESLLVFRCDQDLTRLELLTAVFSVLGSPPVPLENQPTILWPSPRPVISAESQCGRIAQRPSGSLRYTCWCDHCPRESAIRFDIS